MSVQNYSNASALLRNTASRKVVDPSARPTDLFDLLVQSGRVMAGVEPFRHTLITSNNSTAERFTEDQALPDGARRGSVQVSLSALYWREVVKMTGRVRDINAGGGFVDDVLAGEIENSTLNMLYLFETDSLGSTQDVGLLSIIDDSDIYGGVNPGTYTAHASYVSTTVGSITAAKWEDHYEGMQTSPYNCRPTHILLNTNQDTNYGRTMGPSASSTPARIILNQPGSQGAMVSYDIGISATPKSFNNIPLHIVRAMSTTDILFVDMNDLALMLQRAPAFEPLGKRNDNVEGVVSMGGALVVENRRLHSKMEGCTA